MTLGSAIRFASAMNKGQEERTPLLSEAGLVSRTNGFGLDSVTLTAVEQDPTHGETYDNVPKTKRKLGLMSASFLIFNRIIGSGIYATPSNILRVSGSVGVFFIMWLLGAFVAICGTVVYMEFGTSLPRNGGEKNYLEFVYRRPKFLISCGYMAYALIMNTSTANSVVFNLLHSLSVTPSYFHIRLVAFSCLTFMFLMHGTLLSWGVRLQNTLGVFKLVVLSVISLTGILCFTGIGGLKIRDGYEKPDNYRWETFWEGSRGKGANAFVIGLYNVTWSFLGYTNANYALSEVRDPVRTLKRAAPFAMFLATAVYILINIAYFSVVSKKDILESKRIIAALYFRNLFDPQVERALSLFIALSTLGNLLSGHFSQGRVIQELGREGVMPFSSFFASNKPFNAPLAGLSFHYIVSCLLLFLVPPGDTYLFLINLSAYCTTVVYTFVSLGLLLLHTSLYKTRAWSPPFEAPKILILLYFVSNVCLLLIPFLPPVKGSKTYERLAYWTHPVGGILVSLFGISYWYVWTVWLPKRRRYKLRREWVLQEDGVSRFVFKKVPLETPFREDEASGRAPDEDMTRVVEPS